GQPDISDCHHRCIQFGGQAGAEQILQDCLRVGRAVVSDHYFFHTSSRHLNADVRQRVNCEFRAVSWIARTKCPWLEPASEVGGKVENREKVWTERGAAS